jgi:hypothetical protein
MGRRLWSPYTRESAITHVEKNCIANSLRPRTTRDTLPREHFFASFSSTAHLEPGPAEEY